MKKIVVLVLLCVGIIVTNSKANIQLINASRSVSADNNKGSSVSKSTSDFGLFHEDATVTWEVSGDHYSNGVYSGSGTETYYADGYQSSIITSNGITANGGAEGDHSSFYFWSDQPLTQNSSSSFQVDFRINAPCEVFLTGNLGCGCDWGGTDKDYSAVSVTLSGQTGEIFSKTLGYWTTWARWTEEQINETFVFDVGLYTLSAYANTYGFYDRGDDPGTGGGGDCSYNIVLTPEPCTLALLALGGLAVARRRR